MKKFITLTFVASILATGMLSAAAKGYTEYPREGGQWNWGSGITGNYSDYIHDYNWHAGIVRHSGGESRRKDGPKKWAKINVGFPKGEISYGFDANA